ncbi:hypothetical protein [Microlunatus parietis]|uniref:UDP:flavonoid glycosyltransferase YjiC (YdhE family) n=1 Tax=Microlunatus parietis TaxID=682979 RepID=A0A7Y9I498_9ACTN|nr:UDP:flavonoid glycosyltransferase YjiC (YdhE family) [Microlunatus parietis]
MKVLIMTMGTRGDVQPFVAPGQALAAAGLAPVAVHDAEPERP